MFPASMPETELLPTTTKQTQFSFAKVTQELTQSKNTDQRAHNKSQNGTNQQQKQETNEVDDPMKELRKYILLLARWWPR